MLETSARLLSLLSLLQARREWPGPELAERLEVGVRTIRRDIEVAWAPDRQDWRTYRVEPGICLGRRFEPRDPPGGDVRA